MTLHLTGGKAIGTIDGRDVGRNSPGHRQSASANSNPTRMPRSRGARMLVRRPPPAFRGQMNTSRESPVKRSDKRVRFLAFCSLIDLKMKKKKEKRKNSFVLLTTPGSIVSMSISSRSLSLICLLYTQKEERKEFGRHSTWINTQLQLYRLQLCHVYEILISFFFVL